MSSTNTETKKVLETKTNETSNSQKPQIFAADFDGTTVLYHTDVEACNRGRKIGVYESLSPEAIQWIKARVRHPHIKSAAYNKWRKKGNMLAFVSYNVGQRIEDNDTIRALLNDKKITQEMIDAKADEIMKKFIEAAEYRFQDEYVPQHKEQLEYADEQLKEQKDKIENEFEGKNSEEDQAAKKVKLDEWEKEKAEWYAEVNGRFEKKKELLKKLYEFFKTQYGSVLVSMAEKELATLDGPAYLREILRNCMPHLDDVDNIVIRSHQYESSCHETNLKDRVKAKKIARGMGKNPHIVGDHGYVDLNLSSQGQPRFTQDDFMPVRKGIVQVFNESQVEENKINVESKEDMARVHLLEDSSSNLDHAENLGVHAIHCPFATKATDGYDARDYDYLKELIEIFELTVEDLELARKWAVEDHEQADKDLKEAGGNLNQARLNNPGLNEKPYMEAMRELVFVVNAAKQEIGTIDALIQIVKNKLNPTTGAARTKEDGESNEVKQSAEQTEQTVKTDASDAPAGKPMLAQYQAAQVKQAAAAEEPTAQQKQALTLPL